MLVGLASIKGAPGVTTTAVALAVVWPRPVVVLEADPAGGDIAYNFGGAPRVGDLVGLATSARAGAVDWSEHTQELSCGVPVITGVPTRAQGRRLASLWLDIAEACQAHDTDVLIDFGRLDPEQPGFTLAQAVDWLLPVVGSSLASVLHARDGLSDVLAALPALTGSAKGLRVNPVVVTQDAHRAQDRTDIDQVLAGMAISCGQAFSMSVDARAVAALANGVPTNGWLGRSVLLRGARELIARMVEESGEGAA